MVRRIILVALRNLLRQPFRTFLILQGVIWGTALGVFPPAVINGSMKLAETQASRLGTDRLLITQDAEVERSFDWELIDRLRTTWSPVVRHCTALHVERQENVTFLGTDSSALAARGLTLARGRFLTEADLREQQSVAVLEAKAARQMFADADPIGQTVTWSGRELQVIGVTAPRAEEGDLVDEFGYDKSHPLRRLLDEAKQYVGIVDDENLNDLSSDSAVMIPHTLMPDSRPHLIEMRADPRDVLRVKDQVQQELSVAGYEPQIYSNAILPVLYGETIKSLVQLNRAIFGLSICVGTAIVCSIMVLSVLERQREIAIRRVEGATVAHRAAIYRRDGHAVPGWRRRGRAARTFHRNDPMRLEPMGSVTWTFPPVEVAVLVAVVTIVGFIGGLLPAWRAMRVDPVEMLR